MKEEPEFNIHFVGLVQRNACLYDSRRSDYGNKAAQDKAWEKVANEIAESVTDCKERWKNIRGCYTRYLKGVQTGNPKKPYYLSSHLAFVRPFTKSRCAKNFYKLEPNSPIVSDEDDVGNMDDNSVETTNESHPSPKLDNSNELIIPEPTITINRQPPPQNKYHEDSAHGSDTHLYQFPQTNKHLVETHDPDMMFLLSMLPEMKDMSKRQKRRFKFGVLNLANTILGDSKILLLKEDSNSCNQSESTSYILPHLHDTT